MAGAGLLGGAMNALAGGGTFATLPALIAVGAARPDRQRHLQRRLAAGRWGERLGRTAPSWCPSAGVSIRALAAITFCGGLIGSLLLVWTPTRTFDIVIPWLLLYATLVLAFGGRAAAWLHARLTIGRGTLIVAQAVLGVYGGYFGGGVGLMMTATYGLLAGLPPRAMFAPRTLMLAVANLAAAGVFVVTGLIAWSACLPMMAGATLGGWVGAGIGKRLPAAIVRLGTLAVSILTTFVFFMRAYS